MSARDEFPALAQMLGTHLHQDWDLDFENAEAALQAAVADSSAEQIGEALRELLALLATPGDLREQQVQLCDYWPPGDGVSHRAWLEHVQNVLADAS